MILPPLVERELRGALRRKGARQTRMKYARLATGITAVFLLLAGSLRPGDFGRGLHSFLFLIGLYIAVIQTPALTADLFCLERRNRTLGLLFLAGLRPGEIFVNKVLGGALLAFNNLLALVPFLAIPFLSGGISFSLFSATVCCLPNLLLFALAVTILCSVICEEESSVTLLAAIIGAVVCGLMPAIYLASCYFSIANPISHDWLLASPGFGAYIIYRNFAANSPAEFWFWTNSAVTLGWTALALGLADLILRRTWQDRPNSDTTSSAGARLRNWFHGSSEWRHKMAGRWLDMNPFTWLAMYDRTPERLAWVMLAGIIAVWLAALYTWPKQWPIPMNCLITAVVLNGSVEWIANYTAGKRLGEDRRNGALELLLTSSLAVPQIVAGQIEALRKQFQPVFRATFAFNLAMMVGGFFLRQWNELAVCVYVIVWVPILLWSWRCSFPKSILIIWVNLNCARPAYAVWRVAAANRAFSWVWIPFFLTSFYPLIRSFPSGSLTEFIFILCIVGIAFLVLVRRRNAMARLKKRLFHEFRSIAQESVPEPHDPRFQHWNIEERFGCTSPDKEVVLNPRTEMHIRKIARWAARWTARPTILALTKVRECTKRWRRS